MAAIERRLENLAAGTRDRALHALLRDLLRQMSAVYLSAPGVDLQPHRVALSSLFDALESAERLAGKALDRAVQLQAASSASLLPSRAVSPQASVSGP